MQQPQSLTKTTQGSFLSITHRNSRFRKRLFVQHKTKPDHITQADLALRSCYPFSNPILTPRRAPRYFEQPPAITTTQQYVLLSPQTQNRQGDMVVTLEPISRCVYMWLSRSQESIQRRGNGCSTRSLATTTRRRHYKTWHRTRHTKFSVEEGHGTRMVPRPVRTGTPSLVGREHLD